MASVGLEIEFCQIRCRRLGANPCFRDGSNIMRLYPQEGGIRYLIKADEAVLPQPQGNPPNNVNTSMIEVVTDPYIAENQECNANTFNPIQVFIDYVNDNTNNNDLRIAAGARKNLGHNIWLENISNYAVQILRGHNYPLKIADLSYSPQMTCGFLDSLILPRFFDFFAYLVQWHIDYQEEDPRALSIWWEPGMAPYSPGAFNIVPTPFNNNQENREWFNCLEMLRILISYTTQLLRPIVPQRLGLKAYFPIMHRVSMSSIFQRLTQAIVDPIIINNLTRNVMDYFRRTNQFYIRNTFDYYSYSEDIITDADIERPFMTVDGGTFAFQHNTILNILASSFGLPAIPGNNRTQRNISALYGNEIRNNLYQIPYHNAEISYNRMIQNVINYDLLSPPITGTNENPLGFYSRNMDNPPTFLFEVRSLSQFIRNHFHVDRLIWVDGPNQLTYLVNTAQNNWL